MKVRNRNSQLILMSVFIWIIVLSCNSIAYSQNIDVIRYYDSIVLEKGSESLKEVELEADEGQEDNVKWELIQIGKDTLSFGIDGPHGSGRYWYLNILKVVNNSTEENIGARIDSWTQGFRTFLNPEMYWFEDIDLDGDKEFILWDTFEYFDNGIDRGLIAWVYKWDGKNSFVFSPELTKRKGKEIVSIYRAKIHPFYDNGNYREEIGRDILADALEEYLNEYLK